MTIDSSTIDSSGFGVTIVEMTTTADHDLTEGYQKQIDPVWSRDQFEGFMKVIAKITNGQESNVFLFGSDVQVVTRLPNYWDRIVKEENQWEVS